MKSRVTQEKEVPNMPELAKQFQPESLKNCRPEGKKCEMCGAILQQHDYDHDFLNERWKLDKCPICIILSFQGVQKRYLRAKMSDFHNDSTEMVKKSLYIHGPRGTGKTHLIAAFIRDEIKELLKNEDMDNNSFGEHYNNYPRLVDVPSLLLEIRQTFNQGTYNTNDFNTEKDIIEKYSTVPTLYLDDLGAEKSTNWAIQTLYLIIDHRYSNEMKTIITSNLTLDEIADKLDDRISSRIAGMCEVIRKSL